MKKKIVIIVLAVLLLIPMLSITAFAADDDFSFWDLIDSIGDGINAVIKSISNGIKAIGNFFANLVKAIGNAVNSLLNGIKSLFIPRDDYFPSFQKKIREALGKKFGSVIYLVDNLIYHFSRLSSYKNENALVLTFPSNSLLAGNSLNLFGIGSYDTYEKIKRMEKISVKSGFIPRNERMA